MYYQLTDSFEVSASQQAVWDFFSSAENLAEITPQSLNFVIHTPKPVTIQQDAILDYTVRPFGLPVRWRTLIIDWSPPHQFIDLQIRGPYTLWHHQHTFKPTPEGTVQCFDRVIYKLPLGILGRLVQPLVKRELLTIFRYRREIIKKHLGWVRAIQNNIEISPFAKR